MENKQLQLLPSTPPAAPFVSATTTELTAACKKLLSITEVDSDEANDLAELAIKKVVSAKNKYKNERLDYTRLIDAYKDGLMIPEKSADGYIAQVKSLRDKYAAKIAELKRQELERLRYEEELERKRLAELEVA